MKRNLFDELSEGFQSLSDEREGKITLKKHTVEKISAPELKSGWIEKGFSPNECNRIRFKK